MSIPDDTPDLNPKTIAEYAAAYRRLGLQIMPCQDKKAVLPWKEFQNDLVGQDVFDGLYGAAGRFVTRSDMGMCVITGKASGNIIMLDLDTYKPGGEAATNWLNSVIEVHNCGFEFDTWEQVTGRGGRQLFFKCPDGWMISNASTDLNIDLRGQGGYTVVPPTDGYHWRPGRAPWEIKIEVAQQWLLDEIERLVHEHGGGSIKAIEAGERPVFDGFQRTSFGTIADGRERYMRDLIWAALIGYKIEEPIRPGKKELDFVYLDYSRNVKVQEPLPGESHEDGLEREERGYSKFTEKWSYALKQWDGRIEEAAGVRKARGVKALSHTPQPEPVQIDPATGKPLPIFQTSAQFVAGFVPPDYLVDGIIQCGFLYSLTARTNHGKTSVCMYVAQSVARSAAMHYREVKGGTVLFFAGENPDDIRMRFLTLAEVYGFDPDKIKIRFKPGIINIHERFDQISAEADTIDDLALVIVDTAAAYFTGDDTNNNNQQGVFARQLRRLTTLRGKPAVIVNCHPIKNAARDNLLPMGGSAFVNEVDGNLTLWANGEKQTSLHWLGKFRGPEFDPVSFDLVTASTERVKDAKGRLIPSVVAKPISEITLEASEVVQEQEENRLLTAMHDDPRASFTALATRCKFVIDGRPLKTKVGRLVQRLAEDKMLSKHRGGKYRLTQKGRREIGVESENDDD